MSLIEVRTSHFEGSRTSHDWQPYEVEIVSETSRSIIVRCARLIEGRKRDADGLYRLRKDQVRDGDTSR